MIRRALFTSIAGLALVLACEPYVRRQPPPVDAKAETETQAPEVRDTPSPGMAPESATAFVFVAHPDGDPRHLLDALQREPGLRMTLVFPAHYFRSESSQETIEGFKTLVSSNQVEIALTLENQPNLPLIGNLALAPDAVTWQIPFSWPEDIANQVARGMDRHYSRWGVQAAGLYPPYLASSYQAIEVLRRFRLDWTLVRSADPAGARRYGPVAVLRAPPQPFVEEWAQGSVDWAGFMSEWVAGRPIALVDASLWDDPRTEHVFLSALAARVKDHGHSFIPASEWTERIAREDELPDDARLFDYDFSDWSRSEGQRRAWRALSKARDAVDRYKNSGQANLKRYDLAIEEIMAAESGPFLLALGQSRVPLTLNQRNFVATLDNVYRLCGYPIPGELQYTFSNTGPPERTEGSGRNKPFLTAKHRHLTWNDRSGDDTGGGTVVYPTGDYPQGSFDLRQFHVEWNDSVVTFTANLGALAAEDTHAVWPMIDVYIDINRVPGAGSTAVLPNRGPLSIDRDGSWEYAVAFDPKSGRLYQSVIAGTPREVRTLKTTTSGVYNSIAITIPRSAITNRNDPADWRLSVGLSGSDSSGRTMNPAAVRTNAGAGHFGGAATGRNPPAYIDVLADSGAEQQKELSRYVSGRDGRLPFVEAR